MIKNKLIDKLHQKTLAMSRGILILDENLANLDTLLRKFNFRIIDVPKGMSDEEITEKLLSGRIFVTNNSKDFIGAATRHEIGIISTESIKSKDPNYLAIIISDAYSDYELRSKTGLGWLLILKEDKKHIFKELT